MNLLVLAPDIQEEILFLPASQSGRDAITLLPPSADRSGAILDKTTPPLASTQATVGAERASAAAAIAPLASKEKAQGFRIAKRPPRIGLENSPRKLTAANPEISRVFSQKT